MNYVIFVVALASMGIVSIWSLYCAYRHYTAARHARFVWVVVAPPVLVLILWLNMLKG